MPVSIGGGFRNKETVTVIKSDGPSFQRKIAVCESAALINVVIFKPVNGAVRIANVKNFCRDHALMGIPIRTVTGHGFHHGVARNIKGANGLQAS